MQTQVKTPREAFFMPQRLLVPLFQRPYVWTREGQWEPLWEDVHRLANRMVLGEPHVPHFLGAIVVQQQLVEMGTVATWSVIDGQQRLTTLQLMLDAIHEEVLQAGFPEIAHQVSDLVENPAHFRVEPEDRFKVWPTNRDRPAFQEVMSAEPPVQYKTLEYRNSRLAKAHEFFSGQVRAWLSGENRQARAHALVQAVSNLLQIVVIDLQADEDAQEIFETLNARGTPLTAADLIKNFVFQRLDLSPDKVESAYHEYWAEFETPFWEASVSSGSVSHTRSSLFLNQWLITQLDTDVPAKEVFSTFKRHVTDTATPIGELLGQIRAVADVYRRLVEGADDPLKEPSRVELFLYRTATLESEVLKPLVIWMTDPALPSPPTAQVSKAVACLESWLVRRACVRASNKTYKRVVVDLLTRLKNADRSHCGDVTEAYLAAQTDPTSYWPGDREVRAQLRNSPVYRRFRRGRLRMILEALEDHQRGWDKPKQLHEARVLRGRLSIEHVMPQQWQTHWPEPDPEVDRDELVHTLGNLTLTTRALNSRVSNGPWQATDKLHGKRGELEDKGHTAIALTAEVVKLGDPVWTDALIIERTELMIDRLLATWPVPAGHEVRPGGGSVQATPQYVTLEDLVDAGLLAEGQTLYAHRKEFRGREATISSDFQLVVGGVASEYPTGAARLVFPGAMNGWHFWQTDIDGGDRLVDLRHQYAADRGLLPTEEDDGGIPS